MTQLQNIIDDQRAQISSLQSQLNNSIRQQEALTFKNTIKLSNMQQKHKAELEVQKENIRKLEAGCQELRNRRQKSNEHRSTQKASEQQLMDELRQKEEGLDKFERALKLAVANNNKMTKTLEFWKQSTLSLKHELNKLKHEQKVLAQKTK